VVQEVVVGQPHPALKLEVLVILRQLPQAKAITVALVQMIVLVAEAALLLLVQVVQLLIAERVEMVLYLLYQAHR